MAIIGAVSSASSRYRQVGGFVAQLPAPTPTPSPQAQAGHRHIPPNYGVPITSRLEPDDKVVEVVSKALPFIDVPNVDAEQELEMRLRTAEAVAVIEVTNKESAFNAAEDWIMSTLTVEVREVLKDTTGQLVAGNLLEVRESGGEVVLPDGRRIIVRQAVIRPTRVGGVYLATLGFWKGQFLLDMSSVEFNNGQITRLRLDAPPNTDLEQKTPEWATQRARALAERRQP